MKRLDIRRKELWINIEQALQLRDAQLADGIGFILLDSDMFVLDLDDCYNSHTKQLSNFAQEIVEHFKDTYIEVSPSNQGLHVIGLGRLDLDGKSRSTVNKHVEAYDGLSVRYITITGQSVNNNYICEYDSTHQSIQWFKKKFFSNNNYSSEKFSERSLDNWERTEPLHNLTMTGKNSKIDDITTRISNSSDKQLFHQLKDDLRVKNSPSEDDWLFCKMVLRYITTENINEK